MPLYEATGWDRTTTRQATWYLQATTEHAATFYASNAGLLTPALKEIAALPAGERAVNVEDELSSWDRRVPLPTLIGDRLIWRIALGVMLGILGASMVLTAFKCAGTCPSHGPLGAEP